MRKIIQPIFRWYRLVKERRLAYRNFIVVSYPKSGRTWLRVMLDKLGARLTYTHDTIGRLEEDFLFIPSKYKSKRVILLVRYPLDVVVSYYFQMTRRGEGQGDPKCEGWTLSEFIRDDRVGIKSIIKFYNEWSKNKDVPKDFLLIKYEEMHKDTAAVLREVIRFLQESVNEKSVRDVVSFAEFSNMQKMEKEGDLSEEYGRRLTPDDINDINTYKVRRGIIGGYADYMSQEDIVYCKREMKEKNCAFYEPNI